MDAGGEDWTSYAPLEGTAKPCSFCGRPQDRTLPVVHSGDGSAAICEECVERFARFFAHRRGEAPPAG